MLPVKPLLQASEVYSLDQQFMFGPSLLVAPVMEQGASSKEVYLPAGSRWYDAHTGQEVKPSTGWLASSSQQSLHQVGPPYVQVVCVIACMMHTRWSGRKGQH